MKSQRVNYIGWIFIGLGLMMATLAMTTPTQAEPLCMTGGGLLHLCGL